MSNVDDKISLLKDRGFEAGPYGTNAGETKRAVTEALMQAKNEYFNNDQLLNNVAKNSEEANELKAMNEKIISKLPQMKAQLESSKEAINTVLENAYDFSKANNPEDINKAKQIAAGDYEMINQDGELAYKLPNGDTISLEGFRSMVDNIQLPANKEMNELMVNNFNLKDKVGKLGQTVDLDKEQVMFKQMITDPTDTNGNRNPKVVTERLKSFLNDFDFEGTFGKSAVTRLTDEVSKGNFENAVNALSEWNRGKQEEIIKGAQAPAEPSQPINKPNEPSSPREINFNDIRSVDSEISRLENMSQQERQDLDYFEGSVEGSVIQRLAKLKEQKQALQSKNEMQNRSNFN